MAGNEFFGFNTTQAKTLDRLMQSDDAGLAVLATSVTNLNAWATATATKLNANFVAANAEATLPFSPALAVNFDTNPQA